LSVVDKPADGTSSVPLAAGRPAPSPSPSPSPSVDRTPARPLAQGSPGLTIAGVAVVLFAVSLVGMLVNVFTGSGIGWLFGGAFVAACCYAAAQVRRSDLIWAVVVPPLVFAVLVVPHEVFTAAGGTLSKVVAGMNGLLDYGPMLWLGTAAAAAIVAWRHWGVRFRSPGRS
jgi:hypothetical protein